MTIVRYLISGSIKRKWSPFQLDVNNIFLHDFIDNEIYMIPPEKLKLKDKTQIYNLKKLLNEQTQT